ncbi:MAG: diaminopimelate decarboxylase [Gammaproteobacteria bacterium]|nr:diaminopimelate decarboxylase [Gammaproteobacteria bacterium]
MDHFKYKQGELYAESIAITGVAKQFGTPCYIYSRATIERHWQAFDQAFGTHPHLVCYAVKANSNLAVLNIMARMGSGFDIVSRGELERVLKAGGSADKIVFSGVGKSQSELIFAIKTGIRCFNVESIAELERLNQTAASLDTTAPVSIRVNPNVDAKTHPYISTGLKENKFGIDITKALPIYQQASGMSHIDIKGVDCHIGSQLVDSAPFIDALERVLELIDQLAGFDINIQHLDIGGGLGIRYQDETPPKPADYAKEILNHLGDRNIEILIEPGRAIVGNAGVLVTTVEYLKHTEYKNFAIVDAAMNDLLRPALYSAWQEIIPVITNNSENTQTYDIVGPICETGDFLGKDRQLSLQQGDLLAVRSCGAYGFGMSSNYNSRPRVAEIMVDGDQAHLIRKRETIDDLMAGEQLLP